jgi:hypothetical protein
VLNAANTAPAARASAAKDYRGDAVKDLHIAIGCLALGLNLLAFLWGSVAWLRKRPSDWFWRLLRSGQIMVVVECALGGVLLLMGKKASNLHLLYGVLPVVVALIAEQLKISAATQILDAHKLPDAQAVGQLPQDEQRAIVIAIMRREIGAMTLSALVVTALLVRAATVIH